jgi:lysozyme family protein
MADFKIYFPIENELEGTTFEDDPLDSGGATKFGLTLDDLQTYYKDKNKTADDVKNMDAIEAATILKSLYWDYYKADEIPNQSLAMFLVDSRLNQGNIITKYIQQIIGVKADGIFGNQSFQVLLAYDEQQLFKQLYNERLQRYNNIVSANPSQEKFLKGWINRLNAIQYKP